MDNDFFTLKTDHFTIEGRSRAGHESWFRIRELNVGLDIGRGPDALVGIPDILVSHAHLDHSVGIPFWAGQRRLQRLPPGRLYVPEETADDFRELMAIHSRLEKTQYDIEIIGMAPGESHPLRRPWTVRAHDSSHRVPSRAWELIERRHHLRKEYKGLDRQALESLRQQGIPIADETDHSMLFYTGDTDRGILETNDALFHSEVLMIECSFVLDEHHAKAATYRHIHVDDLADFADRFENKLIVLTHFSRRYSHEELAQEIGARLPKMLRERIRLGLPEPWQRI
ncbi:MAG TPA: MBL fold metallo-hydrolase [Thermoanaerobaculia bacterium]|nr:MBL fold metallo-hydrolase [Thermoanaerobaculia bacterium]